MTLANLFGEVISQDEMKTCRDCGEVKHITEFEVNRRFYDKTSDDKCREVRRPTCRDCRSKKKSINSKDAKNYIRPDTLTCPICRDVVPGSYARLDHSHETGMIRGWICDNCNTALGKLKESPEVLSRAIDWLNGEEEEISFN
jgi:hypothetical protein